LNIQRLGGRRIAGEREDEEGERREEAESCERASERGGGKKDGPPGRKPLSVQRDKGDKPG